MAEEKKDEGGSGTTLETALESFKQLMPAIKMIMDHINPSAAATTVAGDAEVDTSKKDEKKDDVVAKDDAGGTEKKDSDEKDGAGMDAAEVSRLVAEGIKSNAASIVRRDVLAKSIATHVGTFDHSDMTEAEVAAYGVKKLSISAPAGQEASYLAGFLAAKGNPADKAVARTAHAMDAAPAAGSAVSRFLNPTEA